MILSSERHLFDIPRDICYLNAAYMTPLLKAQVRAGEDALKRSSHPWEIGDGDFFDTAADVCRLGAQIMNVAADDVAIVPSAGYGISTAARNIPLTKGQVVLVLEEEFPSNYYPWSEAVAKTGAEVVAVQKPAGDDWTNAIMEVIQQLDGRLAVVSIANVHWSSGAVIDLKKVSRACKEQGAALVLDLSQSLGAMPIDIADIDPDFMVAAGYKWLLAPYSISLLYVAPRWQGGVPLEGSWITREGSRDFSRLVNYRDTFEPGARRFDMGERANHILAPIFKVGLQQLLSWGIENIADTLGAVNGRLAEGLMEQGFHPIAQEFRCQHILGVRVGERGPQLLEFLKKANVSVSLRGDLLRVAPHIWTDEEDEEAFLSVLSSA